MSENTLKFDNIEGSKKEFHKSKQPIDLNLAKVDQLLISDNLSIVVVVLNILLNSKKMKLLNCYALSYLK